MLNLPTYTCHKTVQAAKVLGVKLLEGGRRQALMLQTADNRLEETEVDQDWMIKHKPTSGGYYVVYADGYTSFSPAEAFEAGYTLA